MNDERREFKLPGQSDSTGLACPECGCRDFRVVNTYPFIAGSKARRRKCRHCGNIIKTAEVVLPDD